MKVVYSPNKSFKLNKTVLDYLFKTFGITEDLVNSMSRHDPRLIESVEYMIERSGGMHSFVIRELTEHQKYEIVGTNKEILVIGDSDSTEFPIEQIDHIIWHKPVTLESADLSQSCVYDRKYGVIYVPTGAHALVMQKLLTLHLKLSESMLRVYLNKIGQTSSDFFINHFKGCCFRSSVSNKFTIGCVEHLTPKEFELLSPFGFDEVSFRRLMF